MQSFAIDGVAGHVYVVQIVQSGTPLLGDGPDDLSWSARSKRGDLVLSRLDLHGNLLGHMYLKGFGHGVAIGLEGGGNGPFLWTEVDAVAEGPNGWGTRLARFVFRDGSVLDARSSRELERRELLPAVDRTTANIDPVYGRLVMRYRKDGQFRFALFSLAEVARERGRYDPVADVAQPPVLAGRTFQGYAAFGRYLYLLDGDSYGPSNPQESRGNAHLTRVNLRTGAVDRARTTDGHELYRREPEGIGIHAPGLRPENARLCLGFGTSLTPEPAADRLCTIFYKDVLRPSP
jgi:receptor-binding protein